MKKRLKNLGDSFHEIKDMIDIPKMEILEDNVSYIRGKLHDGLGYEYVFYKDADSPESLKIHEQCKNSDIIELDKFVLGSLLYVNSFQDKEIPPEFKEVIMFHGANEIDYFDIADDQRHAKNDDILYILKYFTPEILHEYFEFVKNYREKIKVILELKNDETEENKARRLSTIERIINYSPSELKNLMPGFGKNKEIVLYAVKICGTLLEYASEELKNDPETVLEAIKNDATAFQYASERLKNDRNFVVQAINSSEESRWGHSIFRLIPDTLKNDRKIFMAAMAFKKLNYADLEHLPPELQNNSEFFIEAAKYHYGILRYASNELKNDYEIVLKLVQLDPQNIKYASANLQWDPDIRKAARNSIISKYSLW